MSSAIDVRSDAAPTLRGAGEGLEWIRVADGAPYFETASGAPWTPIGHNEALTWPHFADLLSDPARTAEYFETLRAHGVTCLRLMLEYAQGDSHYFELPDGHVNPRIVETWDSLFTLAERHGMRFLLTPFDTFWMWKRWRHHPYNVKRGGPAASRHSLLTSPAARVAIKNRLAFAIDRWGGSGALFAWDLWNELHPAYAEDDVGRLHEVIDDLATFVRAREQARFGRSHPLTVSAFGPLLTGGFRSRELGQTARDPRASEAIYRHAALDFATVHTYAHGTIDDPSNTVDAALVMGRLTRDALAEVPGTRPFFDSEHGPIHTFKDKRRTLPERFDDEYFRHVQWAHVASGGAGGGMRWPNRRLHVLTTGMHAAQRALAGFLPLVDWSRFRRVNLNGEIRIAPASVSGCACGDAQQAVVWLIRREPLARNGMLDRRAGPCHVHLDVPGLAPGSYQITTWNTDTGVEEQRSSGTAAAAGLALDVSVTRDLAIAIRAERMT